MLQRSSVALAILSVVLLAAGMGAPPAAAQQTEVDPLVAPLREHLLYARYPDVLAAAGALLSRTDLTARQRVDVLESLAIAQIAESQAAAAQSTLRQLYQRDPGHRLSDPDASPTVLSAFARAREARPATVEVRIEHRPLGRLRRHEAPAVELRFSAGGDAVHEARLAYRVRGATEWSTALARLGPDGVARTSIPLSGPADRETELEYWVEAVAPSGASLAQLGSSAEPLSVRVPPETRQVRVIRVETPGRGGPAPRRGVLEQWWFWTAVGAVLIGGGVAGYVLLGPPSEGPQDGSLGNVTLR